jgi:hypothetical protein
MKRKHKCAKLVRYDGNGGKGATTASAGVSVSVYLPNNNNNKKGHIEGRCESRMKTAGKCLSAKCCLEMRVHETLRQQNPES